MKVPLLVVLSMCAALRVEAAPAGLDVQLLRAAAQGDTKTAQSLIQHGAKVNARNADGATPLMLAAEHDDEPTINFLLNHGADIHAQDKDGFPVLGYGPIFAETFGKRGARATPKDAAALSDLFQNLVWIDSDMEDEAVKVEAKMLLHLGMDLNARGYDEFGLTPLINAVDARASLVPFLLQLGADPNVADKSGRTPLMTALAFDPFPSAGGNSVAVLLLRHGAKLNNRNEFGETALMMAVEANRTIVIRELITRKANPNIRDNYGNTALMLAATGGFSDTARLLLSSGADPNLKNAKGQTALNLAQNQVFLFSSMGPLRDTGGEEAKQRELQRAIKGRLEIQSLLKEKTK